MRVKKLLRNAGLLAAAGVLYLIWMRTVGIGIPCPFRLMTGWKCPGCGVTRMAYALAHLRFREAYDCNPYFLCLLPFLLLYAVYRSRKYICGSDDHYSPAEKVLWVLVLAGAVVFGIIRNMK